MTGNELRRTFLNYFRAQGHRELPGSSLVPAGDPSLLFTNAGMVQFKDAFMGLRAAPAPRVVSVQPCVRAGGKHNDLENVGYTARHHTFFEMLGNFSFGDYFKREAITFAWQFLTQELELPAERLWVTVHEEDQEAERIWLNELRVDKSRFVRLGARSNFWAMGDSGPCGPCTEVFYDHGEGVPGGPPGSAEEDGERYVEIWNLVFMEYMREAGGELQPLPKPSVDTGMGLERMTAVLQGVCSNYDSDLFQPLMEAIKQLSAPSARQDSASSCCVIADHIRAAAFLVADGITPGNEGRPYVLRRILRRALRHGLRMGAPDGFFHTLLAPLRELMGAAYPRLVQEEKRITEVLRREEEQFSEVLHRGNEILDKELAQLRGARIPGALIFRMYDTYGFPVDLLRDIARERRLQLDLKGFDAAMEEQRARARAASSFEALPEAPPDAGKSEFTGYDTLQGRASIRVLLGGKEGAEEVPQLKEGQRGALLLERTPFYATGGGQEGDGGLIEGAAGRFRVQRTDPLGEQHLHRGVMEQGALRPGEEVRLQVDAERRNATARNHSATHLLHAALRKVLGSHVEQKGSLVSEQRLRFDFAHPEALSEAQLAEIETLVNREIMRNSETRVRLLPLKQALEEGALALFGEKYADTVRVLAMGDSFSVELCGGTHVARSGDIGSFCIVSESGIASGVRRIEALSGSAAAQRARQGEHCLRQLEALLRVERDALPESLANLLEEQRQQQKTLRRLRDSALAEEGADLLQQAVSVGEARLLCARLEDADARSLRGAVDRLRGRLGSGVVLLSTVRDGKVALVAGVSADLQDRLPARELVAEVSKRLGGSGGGRADMAQGGGTNAEALPEAFNFARQWMEERL